MGNVYQTGARGMKDRTGECWYMPSQKDDSGASAEEFLVIVASTCKGKYFVHVVLSTHADGKFEFKSMREWSMLPLETTAYKRVG